VEDGKRSGRPKTTTKAVSQSILPNVYTDRNSREKSTEYLAYEYGISRRSVLRVLKATGINYVKLTKKPGLTDETKTARLKFYRDHAGLTLKDWKNVIWTDETSVVLGHRRGAVRVWRIPSEAYDVVNMPRYGCYSHARIPQLCRGS
jgi:hypothetical protein